MTTAAAAMTPEKYAAFSGFGKRFCKSNLSKMPMQANGSPAKSNDSETWAGYSEAVGSLRANEFLGVFLGPGDDIPDGMGLGCLDYDRCMLPGGGYDSKVFELQEIFGGYFEESISQKGGHGFFFYRLDAGFKYTKIPLQESGGAIELFFEKRFILLTGSQPFGHFPISDGTAAVQELISNFSETTDTPAANIDAVKPTVPTGGEWERAAYLVDGLKDKLDNYADYFAVGGALASTFGEKGLELFEKFSENPRYNDSREKVARDFQGFLNGAKQRDGAVYGMGSLVFIGKKYGVTLPVDLSHWKNFEKAATDSENSKIIVQFLDGEWLFNFTIHKWVFFDGVKWCIDDTGQVKIKILNEVAKIKIEAAGNHDQYSNGILRRAMALESNQRLKQALELAAAMLPATGKDFDAVGFICFQNGILNVKTGELLPHSPDLKFTRALSYNFNTAASFPKWDDFQLKAASGSPDVVTAKQRLFGASLSGAPDRLIILSFGATGTGKSAESNAILGALEAFGDVINPDLLAGGNNTNSDRLPQEMKRHMGKLLISSSEMKENSKWNAEIKRISGGDAVGARAMREEFETLKPTFLLHVHTNFKPSANGDEALMTRFRIIPYYFKFVDSPEKLTLEQVTELYSSPEAKEYIFQWLYGGYKMYQATGAGYDVLPGIMQELISEYQESEDFFGLWLSENCDIVNGLWTSGKELHSDYSKYCADNGDKPLNPRSFFKELEKRGFRSEKRSHNVKWFRGLILPSSIPGGDNDF
jgi:P4 family phage/plasmid primase-like protien